MIAISRAAGLALALLLCAGSAQASVSISSAPTQNMSCSAGVCSPTAKDAVLNVDDLTGMLANEDVKITTGNGAVTITVFAPFSWTSTHRLTLDANETVSLRAPVAVAGQGAVTIITNDGGAGGDLIFFSGAKLDFWNTASSLVINGKNYALVNDIETLAQDVASHPARAYALARHHDAGADGIYKSAPIATDFAGIFEGLGHSIDNLHMHTRHADPVGLFATIAGGGRVRDLVFKNGRIEASGRYGRIGFLAGINLGTIENITTISERVFVRGGEPLVGGLVGGNLDIVRHCTTAGSVEADGNRPVAGGLVGYNDGDVAQSHSSAAVTSITAGGLVGGNNGIISLSSAAGAIFSSAPAKQRNSPSGGGLVGINGGGVDQSFASGTVSGADGFSWHAPAYAGGLVGFAYGGPISNSYALGATRGGDFAAIGGLAGGDYKRRSSTYNSSYSVGKVTSFGNSHLGGFVGESTYNPAQDDYWDRDTSGASVGCGGRSCLGVTALSDAQMKSGLPAGFDPTIWAQSPSINNGYPYLIANPPPQ